MDYKNLNAKIHPHLKVSLFFGVLAIVFLVGFFVKESSCNPKRGSWGEDIIIFGNKYKIRAWFYENKELKEFCIEDKDGNFIADSIFYPSGILKANRRKTSIGVIFDVFREDGTLLRRDYEIKNSSEVRRETFSENGIMEKVEIINNTAQMPRFTDQDVNY